MNWIYQIERSLRSAAQAKAPHEWAFLASSSKIEGAVRDALAWALASELPRSGEHAVAREFRSSGVPEGPPRTWADLAVLERGESGYAATMLLEAKAMMAFDSAKGKRHRARNKYSDAIAKDWKKWRPAVKRSEGKLSYWYLLVGTHYRHEIPADRLLDVTYGHDANRAIRVWGSAEGVVKECAERTREALVDRGFTVQHDRFATGSWNGIDVDLLYWLGQPKEFAERKVRGVG